MKDARGFRWFSKWPCLLWLLPVPPMALIIASTVAVWYAWKFSEAVCPPLVWAYRGVIRVGKFIARKAMVHENYYEMLGVYLILPWLIPGLFVCAFYHEVKKDTPGISWGVALSYHVLRMGAYFANYAYVASSIHEEAHMRGAGKSYWQPWVPRWVNYIQEWWMGFFYGQVPNVFLVLHNKVHHGHFNDLDDISAGLEYERASLGSFLDYLNKYWLYSTGIAGIWFFSYRHKHKGMVDLCVTGITCYFGMMVCLLCVNWRFALVYFVFPHFEHTFLLGAISYTWHAFWDPSDLDNHYVASVNILNGQYNIYNADYHVYHHKHPDGRFWEAPASFEKNRETYAKNKATIFEDTQAFELWGMLIAGDFDALASKFVDLDGKMTHEEKKAELRRRVQPIQRPLRFTLSDGIVAERIRPNTKSG